MISTNILCNMHCVSKTVTKNIKIKCSMWGSHSQPQDYDTDALLAELIKQEIITNSAIQTYNTISYYHSHTYS